MGGKRTLGDLRVWSAPDHEISYSYNYKREQARQAVHWVFVDQRGKKRGVESDGNHRR